MVSALGYGALITAVMEDLKKLRLRDGRSRRLRLLALDAASRVSTENLGVVGGETRSQLVNLSK